jgi:TonB family protein
VIAVGAVSLAGIGLVVRSVLRDPNGAVATAQTSPSPPINVVSTPGNASPSRQNVPASTIPVLRNSPSAEKPAGTPQADPVLFPTDSKQLSTSTPTPATDYAKIFTGREVDQKARVLSKPEPSYTEEARKNQIAGTVVLRAVLSSSGEVTNISAVSGLPNGLTERAIAAARQIKFVPATKEGRAVSMWMELQYNFNLY